ncbi:MAG: hypothetical protein JXR40_11695 [Pontiellaceae bacterium]|nr:hypothetical protein [Pontiellaceae bacterium]
MCTLSLPALNLAIGKSNLAIIHWGDARYTSTKLEANAYDLIFLDAFSTQRNSELWTVYFFKKLRRLMKPDARRHSGCHAPSGH